jgi:hypothetical protein
MLNPSKKRVVLLAFGLIAATAHVGANPLTPEQSTGRPNELTETNCTVKVPTLIGKPISAASTMKHPEFAFHKVGVQHATLPKGQIVDQNPRSNIHAVACDKAKMIVYYVAGAPQPSNCEPVGHTIRIGERLDKVINDLPKRLANQHVILRNGQAINLQGNEAKVVSGQWPAKYGQLCDKDKFMLFVACDKCASACERAVVPEIPKATSFRDATSIFNRAGFARVEYRVNERSVALSGDAWRLVDIQLPVPNSSACRDASVILLAIEPTEEERNTIEYILIGLGLLGGSVFLSRRTRPNKSKPETGTESLRAGDTTVRVRVDRP